MPLKLIRQDITRLDVDAVVNAANEDLRPGGGVCGAIFSAAGFDDLKAACEAIGHVDTGSAVATPGFALRARHVIHTAGPVWHGGGYGERELLASCYRSSLNLAFELGDMSIAFPLISSGIYGYPSAEALAVAVGEIRAFLMEQPDMQVTLCLFNRNVTTLTQGLFGQIEQFIDDTYVDSSPFARDRRTNLPDGVAPQQAAPAASRPPYPPAAAYDGQAPAPVSAPRKHGKENGLPSWFHWGHRDDARPDTAIPDLTSAPAPSIHGASAPSALEEALAHLDAPFPQLLLSLIDERELTDAEVYARANLSRQYFSKLRGGKVNPSKRVVLSLAVALELPIDETQLLLARAGHALTHANKFDIIVEWFIRAGRYDVFEINEALFAYDQPLLGAS